MTDDQKEFVALAEEIIARITESHKDPVSNSWPIFGVEGSAPNCWWHDLTGMSKSLEILRRRIQPREEGKPWNYPAFLVTELSANHPPKDITTESLFSKHLARLREVLREKDYIGYMVMLTRDPLVNNSDKIRPLSTLFQYPALNPETNKFEGLEYKIHPDINEYTEYAVTILRRWIRVMSMQPAMAGISTSAGSAGSETLTGKRPPPKATVNMRMLDELQKNPEVRGWTCRQWAKHLKCGASTVAETAVWKELYVPRETVKAERSRDRRRRSKASDRQRD
jgi:hypothetical protein